MAQVSLLGLEELLGRCRFPERGAALDCAVSGGADSLALLALAVAAGCRATAIHVDHGLRPGSADEAAAVEEAAGRLGAAFVSRKVVVGEGPNLEERARTARFSVLPPGVATGHTADDQAETVIINLLRGAGLDGLAGMRPGPRHPILGLRRTETEDLCRRLDLPVLVDPSNSDPRHVRNRVRRELIPALSAVSGRDVVPLLARQAAVVADDVAYLEELASGLDPTDAAALRAAPLPLARRAVRGWLRGEDAHPPASAVVERVLEVARLEAKACEVGGGATVRRRRGRLRIEPPPGDG
jgi:tRNA(Ile)-lysidine synthase